jgi:DNA-directed RNA polymerase specialized sigma24 family protein
MVSLGKMSTGMTRAELERLLHHLDTAEGPAAEKLLLLRQKLAIVFERNRFVHVDELVDQAIDRVATKLATEEISSIGAYAHRVALTLCLEAFRKERKLTSIDDPDGNGNLAVTDPDPEMRLINKMDERRKRECLQKSLQRLAPEERTLIGEYYVGDKQERMAQRRNLAQRLQLPMQGLRSEACAIRSKLRDWFDKCMRVRNRSESATMAEGQLRRTL